MGTSALWTNLWAACVQWARALPWAQPLGLPAGPATIATPGGGAVAWAGVQMKLPRWWGVCTPMWHVSVGPPSGFLCPLLCHLLVPLPAHWGTLAKVMEGVPQEVRRKGGLRVEM